MRILDRYIFKEILFPSLIALVALTFIAFLAFSLEVTPRVFNESIPNVVLYVQNSREGLNWSGILLADTTQPDRPKVIFAQSGNLTRDNEHHQFVLTATNGSTHFVSPSAPDKYS